MDQNERMKALLEKYWLAETTDEEEAELREYFAAADTNHPAMPSALFTYFREEAAVQTDPGFDKRLEQSVIRKPATVRWLAPLMRVAAVLLLMAGAFAVFKAFRPDRPVAYAEKDTYQDPRQAYLESKKALLLVSRQLNSGKSYIGEIKRINQAEQIINHNTSTK